MTLPRTKITKMDKSLCKEFQDIAIERFRSGRDQRYSPPRVQRKVLKHPLWSQIRKDLEISEFLKDDVGQLSTSIFNIFMFGIIAFVTVLFLAGLIFVMGLLNDTFLNVGLLNEVNSAQRGYVNLTLASQQTFGQVNNSIQSLRMVSFVLIFLEIVSSLVIAGYGRRYPQLFLVYIFIVFLAVMLAAPISNAYEALLQSNIYGGLLTSFTGSNWMLLNLPLLTFLVGIFGAMLMFINIARPGNETSL